MCVCVTLSTCAHSQTHKRVDDERRVVFCKFCFCFFFQWKRTISFLTVHTIVCWARRSDEVVRIILVCWDFSFFLSRSFVFVNQSTSISIQSKMFKCILFFVFYYFFFFLLSRDWRSIFCLLLMLWIVWIFHVCRGAHWWRTWHCL